MTAAIKSVRNGQYSERNRLRVQCRRYSYGPILSSLKRVSTGVKSVAIPQWRFPGIGFIERRVDAASLATSGVA
ncbi:unknown [Sutterella sp. CAG:351]|nr:unknown [Sutterella sp. CAG:351]